jgi:predicted transcriptional regulator
MNIEEEVDEIGLRDLFKSLIAQKGMSLKQFAEKHNKSYVGLTMTLKHGKMNLSTFEDYMKCLGEDVVIVLKNGNQYKISVKK